MPVSESGNIIPLHNLKLNFIGKYEKLPGTGAVFCKLDIRVPDNWHLLRPTTPSNGNARGNRGERLEKIIPPIAQAVSLKMNNLNFQERKIEVAKEMEYPKRIKDRKKVDPLPDMSFESLIQVVKAEREQEEADKQKRMEETQIANDPTRMIFTFHDIQQRQKLIDRLMQELEARTEAVKKIGSDLYSARENNSIMEAQIIALKNKIQENDIRTVKLLNTIDIDILPIEELKRRYALLAQKLQLEINKTRDLTDKLESAQKSKIAVRTLLIA